MRPDYTRRPGPTMTPPTATSGALRRVRRRWQRRRLVQAAALAVDLVRLRIVNRWLRLRLAWVEWRAARG